MMIKTDGTLAVYCPKSCSKKLIEDFVTKHYDELKRKHDLRGDVIFGADGNSLLYLGKRYTIINKEGKFQFNGENFFSCESNKEEIRRLYRDFLKKEAKKIIPTILKDIAQKHGFCYNRVSIKAISSRYGSCSSKKNLNFSLALAAFEPEFIQMVVAHELCHTVQLNHSKEFYALLGKIIPNHQNIKEQSASERSAILKSIFFSPAP
jgi:predicted metal-dependent hydrolase